MKKFLRATVFLILILTPSLFGETFRFLYSQGEKYRIISTVREEVLFNNQFSHNAEILNRITVEVARVKEGAGYLVCTFQTSEESRGPRQVFSWGRMYESEFWRDPLGYYTIGPHYFMPIVRNVPVFPEREIKQGDTWSEQGEEVHDFSTAFGIKDPVRFPIDVLYRYEGKEIKDGREYAVIHIRYNVFHRPGITPVPGKTTPIRISGASRQKMLWDMERGRPDAYEEEFNFVFDMSNGVSVEYRGKAEARIVESEGMNKAGLAAEIKKDLADLGVRDTRVQADELGITLTLENIQFPPDSALLVQSERSKLDRIGEILKKYSDRDILITGHTALAGTPEGRKKLSEDRAGSVGAYLLEKNVRTKDRIAFRGLGAEVPVADNRTEDGRSKNRRVEITILEN